MGPIDVDFVLKNTSENDRGLFLGPISSDQDIVEVDSFDSMLMAHLVAQAGIFPSVGQARKNGWNKPVPKGFTTLIIGKGKSKVTILNM